MSAAPPSRLVRACDRCHDRKVKCDGTLPRCQACERSKCPSCNVSDYTMWTNDYVQQLQRRVQWLENLVATAYRTDQPVQDLPTGSDLPVRLEVTTGIRPDPVVEEIGLLSLRGAGSYVGSMAGVTISALIASVLRLYQQEIQCLPPEPPQLALRTRSGHPPLSIAARHLSAYLEYVHPVYPVLDPAVLGRDIEAVYTPTDGTLIGDYGRFCLFTIYALGALDKPSGDDPYTADEYFMTAATFLPSIIAQSDMNSMRAIILACIWGIRSWSSTGPAAVDVWQMAGFGLRLGISLGLTRNSYKWIIPEAERENRRRVWWCVYSVERWVATATGRVLGIRNQGIDAPFPHILRDYVPDSLHRITGAATHVIDLQISTLLFSHRILLGDILETVYITRPGNQPSVSAETMSARVAELQTRLLTWQSDAFTRVPADSWQHDMIQLASFHAILVLYRPSPSFPSISPDALQICLSASRGTIRIAHSTLQAGRLGQCGSGPESFMMVFMAGLCLLYCSWTGVDVPGAAMSTQTDPDIQNGIAFLEAITRRHHLSSRYIDLFRKIVIAFNHILTSSPLEELMGDEVGREEGVVRDAGLVVSDDWDLRLDPISVDMVNVLFGASGAS